MSDNFPQDKSRFKLIVADFDGTLAGPDHKVSEKTVKAVKRWIDSGRHFTIATGRQFLMIEDECKKMGLVDPLIVRAGAEVVDPTTQKVLRSELIDEKDVDVIKKTLDESSIFQYGIEINDVIYDNLDFLAAFDFPQIKVKGLSEYKSGDVAKIHAKPKNPDDKNAEKVIDDIETNLPRINIFPTHNAIFGKGWDITSVRATKLFGIVRVMEILNIKREEIVGVGDSYNDFPLLEAAALKVAMGNGREEIRAVADVIVPSHDQDGVAYLIDKLLE